MTTIHPIRPGDRNAAQDLIASVPPGKIKLKRQQIRECLEATLSLLLDDDPRKYDTACRILAVTIARLR